MNQSKGLLDQSEGLYLIGNQLTAFVDQYYS